MLITVQRRPPQGGATIGEMFLDGTKECFTLEDEPHEVKIPGKTCIPAGKYRVIMSRSPRFNKVLPELLAVPNYTGVRIHSGNKAEDTEGCILVGEEAYENTIGRGREALLELMAAIDMAIEGGEQVWIEVKNPEA